MLPAQLKDKRIVLASASPRRREILERIGLGHAEIIPSTFPETLDKSQFASPEEYVLATAWEKAKEVYERVNSENGAGPAPLVIAADTIVVLDSDILEKPANADHARAMLARLSGRTHKVLTAVIILHPNEMDPNGPPLAAKFAEQTAVTFVELAPEHIEAYVETGEPLDKAGGYGYQHPLGSTLVHGISGCYYNVVGLPTSRLVRELRTFLNNLPRSDTA